jgi:flagellar hook-associated protein 3 FlgL
MPTGSIGTLAQDNLMLQSILQLRSQANDLQSQVSTGLKSQTYSGLGPATSQVANLQSSVAHHQAYLDTITTVQQRINEQSTALPASNPSALSNASMSARASSTGSRGNSSGRACP